MSDEFDRVVELAWRQAPDAAISAGMLPPTAWEDLSREARQTLGEECAALAAGLERRRGGADDVVVDAALHQLRLVAITAAAPTVEMLNHMTGPVARLTWAAQAWPSTLDPDGEVYLDHLRRFVPFCRAVVGACESDPVASRPVLAAFIRQIDAALADNQGAAPPLLAPLPAGSPAARDALAGVVDGLLVLRDYAAARERSAAPASTLAASADGPARYQEAIEYGTSTGLTYEQVEDIGQRLLATTEARFAALAADPRVPVAQLLEPARALDRFRAVHDMLDGALDRVIEHRPAMPCEVRPLPAAHSAVGPPAYYGASSKRSGRPGTLFVNTSPQARTREWEVLPLAMHEGVPGHHLQIALLDESETLPDLVRLLPVNAFTEGWAVYAETLAGELGVDVSPANEFGLLAHQRWRAGRLLVDVGLHAHGWSVVTATKMLAAITRQDPHAVEREVVRYLAWPGQALGYAVGAEVIRRWVERRVAAGADLAAAHSRLLGLGSVPLSILDNGG